MRSRGFCADATATRNVAARARPAHTSLGASRVTQINTERHRLAAAQPSADVCPVIDQLEVSTSVSLAAKARLIARCIGPRPLDGARGRLLRLGKAPNGL